jgi:tetratricopeptide (TPR) repeat protein
MMLFLFFFSPNARYEKKIELADHHFVSESFDQAKENYAKASTIKPEEEYPRTQLLKIDSIMTIRMLEKKYKSLLWRADSLFVVKDYENARLIYLEAARLKADDPYPFNQIGQIDSIQDEMTKKAALTQGNYHIVAGVFEDEENVAKLTRTLQDKGLNPIIIPRKEFEMQAVTYGSYPDIHTAYNNLRKVQNEIAPDAWVIYHRVK